MTVYTDLRPDDETATEVVAYHHDTTLRRLDLSNGRVLYFRAARAPLWALNGDELWTALGLDGPGTERLGHGEVYWLAVAFAETTRLDRVPLAIYHHDGAVTIADLAGANCTTIGGTTKRKRLRRIWERIR